MVKHPGACNSGESFPSLGLKGMGKRRLSNPKERRCSCDSGSPGRSCGLGERAAMQTQQRGNQRNRHPDSLSFSLLPIANASHWLNPTRNQRIRKPIEAEGQPSGTQNRRRVDLERQMENIQQYLFPIMYTNVDRCIQEMTSMDK